MFLKRNTKFKLFQQSFILICTISSIKWKRMGLGTFQGMKMSLFPEFQFRERIPLSMNLKIKPFPLPTILVCILSVSTDPIFVFLFTLKWLGCVSYMPLSVAISRSIFKVITFYLVSRKNFAPFPLGSSII